MNLERCIFFCLNAKLHMQVYKSNIFRNHEYITLIYYERYT